MAVKREQNFVWEGVDRGELVVQKCDSCTKLRHPPLPRCPHCGSTEWSEQQLCGRGTILSWVRLQHPSKRDSPSRLGILVQLEEGVRMVSNLIDEDNAAIGVPVAVEFRDVDEKRLALFRTVSHAA